MKGKYKQMTQQVWSQSSDKQDNKISNSLLHQIAIVQHAMKQEQIGGKAVAMIDHFDYLL